MIVKKRYKRLTKGDWFFVLLMSIGGINWGLIGLFNFNIFEAMFGFNPHAENVISIVVGLATLYVISLLFKSRRTEFPRTYEQTNYRYH